jgi:RNA polymerase sigma-70 factor (sigma-E family)
MSSSRFPAPARNARPPLGRLPGVTMQELSRDTSDELRRLDVGPASFEEFVLATGDRMHRAALLLCGDHHLAEDLTQATYAKVYAAWSTVSAADSPTAYTRTVLLRTFLSHRRLRRSSERPVGELPETAGLAADEPDPGLRLDLLAALRRLSPSDRAVLVLRYWEDLSVAHTAHLLGIRESTCRARASRALARLRTHLPDLVENEDRS